MKILVDLNHPVDVNFFKNAIRLLANQHGYDIEITVQPRGRLVPILRRELPDFPFTCIGRYRQSLPAKVSGAAYRCLQLLLYLHRGKFDAVVSFGGIGVCHAAYLLGMPSVIFDDDVEYGLGFYPYRPFATRIVLPQQIPIRGYNIVKYKGFKEAAYLHPRYFVPDQEALEDYRLRPEEYVFVREVSSISMNYAHLQNGQLAGVCRYMKNLGLQVILSLEDKSLADRFAPVCTILEEPVRDIHSLMHYALFTISSGDTMARESCLTGTPVIYTGGRHMSVNLDLMAKAVFFEPNGMRSAKDLVEQLVERDIKWKTRRVVQRAFTHEWEDTTEVIVKNVLATVKNEESPGGECPGRDSI